MTEYLSELQLRWGVKGNSDIIFLVSQQICMLRPGLPRSGKNIWKMKFFPGQGKVREFCGWSGKVRKDLESQGKVREIENKWLWQADLR